MTKMSNTPQTRLPDGQVRFAGFTDLPAGRQVLGNWCTYVLECENGCYYKGKTNNLERRIQEHCSGNGAKYTKEHKPIKLVYVKGFETESEAVKHEKYLKSGAGREWLKNYLREESVQND